MTINKIHIKLFSYTFRKYSSHDVNMSLNKVSPKIMSAVKEAKAALRKDIEDRISRMSPGEKQRQSQIVREKLFNLEEFKKSNHVSIFLSMDVEIDTEPILRKLFEEGKDVFVPRYRKEGMEMVKLYSMADWEDLPVTKWNIKQPYLKQKRDNALDEGLDLIIAPGVALTKDGWRVGHGAGYYDKYLTKIKEIQSVAPVSVALVFKEQLVDEVPIEPTDVKIDKVLYAE